MPAKVLLTTIESLARLFSGSDQKSVLKALKRMDVERRAVPVGSVDCSFLTLTNRRSDD